jgi:hypothetical protein
MITKNLNSHMTSAADFLAYILGVQILVFANRLNSAKLLSIFLFAVNYALPPSGSSIYI